jgi:tetratricopeptide (TPR) repeat protein
MTKAITLVLAVLPLVFAPAPATAKGKKDKAEKKEKKEAEKIHEQALTLFGEGKYEEAIELFIKADEISPNPFSSYNIAKCYEKMGRHDKAHAAYKDYLATGDTVKLDAVKQAMEAIEKMPVTLRVGSQPEGAAVSIDGEPAEGKVTPASIETTPGNHVVMLSLEGYEVVQVETEIPFGGSAEVTVTLTEKPAPAEAVEEAEGEEETAVGEEEEEKEETGTGEAPPHGRSVPISLGLSAGATVSTNNDLGSLIDASLGFAYMIKGFSVGLGVDAMFFVDSCLLSAYPAGGYSVKLWKNLTLSFDVGFGAAYLYAGKDGWNEKDTLVIRKGNHWDLVVHGDIKLGYGVGHVRIYIVPAHANVLIGVGSVKPAPLAQFAFLLGFAYEF